ALSPGTATIHVWGRANHNDSELTFMARAADPKGSGYRIYAGSDPGYLDVESQEIRVVAGMRYQVLPYVRGTGRGLPAGAVANADLASEVLARDSDLRGGRWAMASSAERTVELPALTPTSGTRVTFAEATVTITWRLEAEGWWRGELHAASKDGA